MTRPLTRREFVSRFGKTAATASALTLLPAKLFAASERRRYAIVGTGIRACFMWGRDLVKNYSDVLELVGLCDIIPSTPFFPSRAIASLSTGRSAGSKSAITSGSPGT